MTLDFSIIIPVYNSEKTIMRCVKSLQAQTMPSFEAILIDDGSLDKSGEICDEIMKRDNRFVTIHQQNSGPSSARNAGLSLAKGRFISFVDSDDTIEPDYLEQIKKQFDLSNADVVFIGYKAYSSEGKRIGNYIPEKYSNDFIGQIVALSAHDLFGYTWIKVFRNNIISTLKFEEDIFLFEDEIFTCKALTRCHTVAFVPRPLYQYVRGSAHSLVGKSHQNYCELQEKVYLAWQDLLTGHKNAIGFLQNKANVIVTLCEYYVYERDVDIDAFLQSMKQCTFFRNCTLDTPFCNALRKDKIYTIKWIRFIYRMKVVISRLIHR